jgi:hypothetical protein
MAAESRNFFKFLFLSVFYLILMFDGAWGLLYGQPLMMLPVGTPDWVLLFSLFSVLFFAYPATFLYFSSQSEKEADEIRIFLEIDLAVVGLVTIWTWCIDPNFSERAEPILVSLGLGLAIFEFAVFRANKARARRDEQPKP